MNGVLATPTCVGPGVHLAPQAPDAQEVAWFGTRVDTARPERWTCTECHPDVHYELCVLGARWFVRRSGAGVYETVRDVRGEAEGLWWQLIAGRAR